MPAHSAPSARPIRPSQTCEASGITTWHGLCDALVAPTDDEADEEEEEVQIDDEDSAVVGENPAVEVENIKIASSPGQPSRKPRNTGRGGTSRTGRGAAGAPLAEVEINRIEHGQARLSPSWPLIISS